MRHKSFTADPDDDFAAGIASIARRQHGVICLAQLIGIGMSRSTVSRWASVGHLHRLHRGVYAVGHPNVGREGHWLAAVLATGAEATASHGMAARVTRLDLARGLGAFHVSVPNERSPKPRGVIVHRVRRLEAIDLTERFGIPTTTVTRTLFDQAPLLGLAALREQFERAEYLEKLDRPRLAHLLDGASGRRGLSTLRMLLGYEPLPMGRIKSELERIVLSTCRTYALPLPLVNVPLLDYEVDFFWPAARFVVEADGGRHIGTRRTSDNARDITLLRAGHLVRRYTEEALADEAAIAREIREILTERLPASA